MAKSGVDASERALNLAMYLASVSGYVSFEHIVAHVEGYDRDAEYTSQQRLFEHDKDFLRGCGLAIHSGEDGESQYKLDASASFAEELDLLPHEASTMRIVGSLVLADPAFPLKADLRLALVKLAEALGGTTPFVTEKTPADPTFPQTPESSAGKTAAVVSCTEALEQRKTLTFRYGSKQRIVQAYGLFSYGRTWYLVAFDTGSGEERTFNCDRIENPEVNRKNPKTPDYEIPLDFNVSAHRGLPFQYGGDEPLLARVTLPPAIAWQADRITQQVGSLTYYDDDTACWEVGIRDRARFLRWLIQNSPGSLIEPPRILCEDLTSGLEAVVRAHG